MFLSFDCHPARQCAVGERVFYRFPYYPFIDGYMPRKDEDMRLNYETTGPRYFQTMRIPLVSRRDFDERDYEGAPGVVIINETMERRYWPPGDALGRRIKLANVANLLTRRTTRPAVFSIR
jgi:hypothetical protein